MIQRPHLPILAAFSLLLLAGCSDTVDYVNENPQRVGAPIMGGAAGVMAGEAIGATAAEVGLGAVGAIAGIAAAPYLEKRDVVFFDKAIDKAAVAKPGEPVHWVNPNTGTTGTMTREGDVDIATDLTCRRLRSEEKQDQELKVETMVVCRPDLGTWYIRSSWIVERKPIKSN